MVSGLYTARDGMMLLQDMVDNTTNNLSNVNTTGFKQSLMASMAKTSVQQDDEQKLRLGESHWMSENYVDWTQGPLVQTDNSLDLAIEGNGFFSVETSQGVRYTRSGSFTRNSDGDLVTLSGNRVLGQGGSAIHLEGGTVSISSSGSVAVDGKEVGQLAIKDFANKNTELVREGANLFKAVNEDNKAAAPAQNFSVRQGMLEGSNASALDGITELIRFSRHFEFDQRAVASIDETLDKAVNEIGQVS